MPHACAADLRDVELDLGEAGIYYPPLRRSVEHRLRRLGAYARTVRITARRVWCSAPAASSRTTPGYSASLPRYTDGLQLGTSGDDGSGIAMAQQAGAVTDRMDNVSAWRFITPPSAFISAIIVDRDGRRIIDETRYGAAVGRAIIRDHDAKAWILADAALMAEARKQLITQTLWFQRLQGAALMLFGSSRGSSLTEVAQRAGIDPDGLIATVNSHNDAIDTRTGTRPESRSNSFAGSTGNRSRC